MKTDPGRTGIQERLVLLVHLKKSRIRVREMEIIGLSGMNKENADPLSGLLESYRRMIFPGQSTESAKDTEMEDRQKALANEAQKAFIVRPVDVKTMMNQAATSTNPDFKKLAGRALVENERERMTQLQRKNAAEASQKARRMALKQKMTNRRR